MSPIVIGILIIVLCGGFGVLLSFYLARRQDKRHAEVERTLDSYGERWDSVLLDPKFYSRGFLKASVAFGDLKVFAVPSGFLLKDGETFHFIEVGGSSALSKVANKSYPLDFFAIERTYVWISGGEGKFLLRGNLVHGGDFLKLAKGWGWPIHEGVPEGADLPRRYKG